jgi:tetratricopeptide (TPR) repeat protein
MALSNPRPPDLASTARRHFESGNWRKCLNCGAAALARHPGHVEVLHMMVGASYRLGELDSAIKYMATLAGLLPEDGDVLVDFATLLAERGHHDRAERAFAAARRAEPASASVALGFARWLETRSRQGEARDVLDDGLTRHPDNIDLLLALGRNLMETPEVGRAIDCLQHALKFGGENATVLADLGDCHIMAGDIAEAARCFRRAIALDRSQAKAYFGLSMLPGNRFDADAVDAMESASSRQRLNADQKVYFAFALGRHYEQTRFYDRAFEHFAEGNRLLRKINPYDIRADEALADAIIAATERVRTARDAVAKESAGRTPIFVLGMPRSGTSLVEQILASHSKISGGGELRVFGDVLRRIAPSTNASSLRDLTVDPEALSLIASDYLKAAGAAERDRPFFTDKTPQSFFYIGLIAAALPDAKIVHVKRDPLDTCLSCFTSLFGLRQRFSNDLVDIGRYYKLYLRLMAHWHTVLPGVVIDVEYKDFVDDLEATTRRLLDRLSLPFEQTCLAFHTTNRPVTTHSAAQVRSQLYGNAVGRWRGYAGHLNPILRELGFEDGRPV